MSLRGANGLLLAATSIFALATAGPTLAQTAAGAPTPTAPTPAAPSDALPTVVVTAQKRSENVQKVAVALTVVGADVMAQNGITNTESLDEVVPSLEFKKGTANVNSTLSIRGIGTQSFSSGAEPSVSTVVDGVVYGRAGMAFQEFTDIDQVEVAGGPQGTLFGKNASAGAVSITTKAPSSVFGGNASFGYYEGGEYRADGNVSGPITDNIRYVLSGVYGDYRGNVFNYGTDKWTNGYHRTGLRGGIVDNVNADLKITLRADWTHADDNCCADILGPYVPGGAFSNVLLPSILPVKAYFGSKEVDNNLTPGTLDSNGGVSGQIDYNMGGFTFTSITAWREWRNKQIRDGDYHDTYGNYVTSTDINDEDFGALNYNQFSQEFRVASPTSGRFNYVVGAFFWYTHENDWFDRYVTQCSHSTLPANSTGFQPCSTTPGVSTISTGQAPALWNTEFYNQALYGQSNYKVTDKLTLVTGLRVSHDRVQYALGRTDEFPAVVPAFSSYSGIGGTFHYAEHAIATGVTAKGGLEYQVTPDSMAYFTYSRGYKGPSLNDYYSEGATNVGEIAPETSNAYEVGAKNQFFGHRLTFNADLFYEEFYNFQANNFVNLNGATVVTLQNAGTVSSRGGETMLTWRATPDLLVSGGYTYDDAIIVAYNCPASLGAANVISCKLVDGRPLPFAPKNKVNVNTSYDVPAPSNWPFKLRLTSTYTYTSWINYDIAQTPLARQPGYGLWDAAALFTSRDGKYHLGFFVKNITNQYYTTFITPGGNGVSAGSYTRLQVPRDAQRYTGVKLTADF